MLLVATHTHPFSRPLVTVQCVHDVRVAMDANCFLLLTYMGVYAE